MAGTRAQAEDGITPDLFIGRGWVRDVFVWPRSSGVDRRGQLIDSFRIVVS